MSAQHTPGPWLVGAGYGAHGVRIEAPDSGRSVCGVIGVTRIATDLGGERPHEEDVPEAWANARLIAAAPDLLRVAQDFSEVLAEKGMFCECGEEDCRTTRLRKAIAKATGEAA